MADSKGRFPGPYLNDVRAEDPMMKRVPPDSLDIGARKSGLPRGPHSEATLTHVGESPTGKGAK